jgi:hypothetical protein
MEKKYQVCLKKLELSDLVKDKLQKANDTCELKFKL